MTFSKGNGLIISNFNNFAFSIKLHTMVYTTIQLNGCNLIAHSMNISSINRFPFCRNLDNLDNLYPYGIKMSYFIEINRNLKKPFIHLGFL